MGFDSFRSRVGNVRPAGAGVEAALADETPVFHLWTYCPDRQESVCRVWPERRSVRNRPTPGHQPPETTGVLNHFGGSSGNRSFRRLCTASLRSRLGMLVLISEHLLSRARQRAVLSYVKRAEPPKRLSTRNHSHMNLKKIELPSNPKQAQVTPQAPPAPNSPARPAFRRPPCIMRS